MRRAVRLLLLVLVTILPWFLKKPFSKFLFGWKIGIGSRVGLSWIDACEVRIGAGVRIGHFNIVRCCSMLDIGDGVTIINGNQFFGSTFVTSGWENSLEIGEATYITSGHFVDLSGGVHIGINSVIGGRGSQIWSHSIRQVGSARKLVPFSVSIGRDTYIGAGAILVCGSIPEDCLVGAGAVVSKSFPETGHIQVLAGNPAIVRKSYPKNFPLDSSDTFLN